jgi:signal transduction histidine kinase
MHAVPVIIASIFGLLLAAIVLVRDFSRTYARAFALVSAAAVVWVISNFFTSFYFGNDALLIAANSVAYFSGYLSIVAGLVFTYYFPVKRSIPKVELILVAVVASLTLLLAPTSLVAGTVTIHTGMVEYGLGVLMWFYAVSFLGALGLITRNLLWLPEEVSRQKRLQAQQVLAAFLISALFGLAVNVVMPMVGLGWEWTELSPFIIIPLVGIIAYSIIRHGLFDIRVTAAKITAFLLTFALFFGSYYYLDYLVPAASFLDPIGEQGKGILQIGIISFLALFGRAFLDYFEKAASRIFFRHSYDTAEFSASINRLVSSAANLQQLLDSATYQIARELDAETAVMVVRVEGNVASSNYGKVAAFDAFLMDIVANMKTETSPKLVEYISEDPVREALSKLGIVLYIPFVYSGALIGFLGLGTRTKGAYNERDVETLAAISTELTVAMQNAVYVQKIQNFNDALKIEVDRATAELRASNQKLKQLDQTKDEFISLTSHQLRTPLTTIKGYISMILDGDVGEVSPQQRKLLEEAFNSSQRMVHLISDFLNISRIQTGKFVIELTDMNLADILDEEIDQLRISATSRKLNLVYDKPSDFPTMPIDEGKIRQVMMNFIDNAIYYSPAGKTITVVLTHTATTVEFKVIDQGIGVPKAEQHKLFAKFSRASNARKQRPDGTGIGLFMAKKVVVALGGAIIFQSEEGKGSTFGFRLNRP